MTLRPFWLLILLAVSGCQDVTTRLALPEPSVINPAGDSEYCPSGQEPPCN